MKAETNITDPTNHNSSIRFNTHEERSRWWRHE